MKFILAVFFFGIVTQCCYSTISRSYITTEKSAHNFAISENGNSSTIYASSNDFLGVLKAINNLQNDVKSVTEAAPQIKLDEIPSEDEVIIIGTLGKNPLFEKLVKENKISFQDIEGKWETFIIQVVENPFPNVNKALVIAGSDKRGTIFGIYDLAENIGVSPWYWWADVPVKKKNAVYAVPGRFTLGEPKVKYRGIFINDEAPALSGWAKEKFGTEAFNHDFYEHVFELILRLKGNFLWPAMWGRAFYDDDPLNPKLADEYGIVIGTSHHEPMMRAHAEWARYGRGPWNYEKNEKTLREFWRYGIERMDNYESIVTLAMRGDGDEAMSENANIKLLEKIVHDQRQIIKQVTGKPLDFVPQVWALYKEVQEYYDKGMRVPEDVTILLCDDNWGNLRKLQIRSEVQRKGGYGIYYHFDYVGGPRNYKWLNTNQIERVWEQMHLAYEFNARQIWIVNVGDIKPMEFPISFFLDYAWNPEQISANELPNYYLAWAKEQFADEYSEEIAELLSKYTKYNARRKPELLSPSTYSLINYREAETIVDEFNLLASNSEKIYNTISDEYRDAYYQLVHHPIIACSNLNKLYVAAAKNNYYFKQGRAETNVMAERVKELFDKDAEISDYYNNILAGGKWRHMMDQSHIGYSSWQQPDSNIMPPVKKLPLFEKSEMGVCAEGSERFFPQNDSLCLPMFDDLNRQSYFVEIFNRGSIPFKYSIKTKSSWINFSESEGTIFSQKRIWISINWEAVPSSDQQAFFSIKTSDGSESKIYINIIKLSSFIDREFSGFIEDNGYISIEANHYSRAAGSPEISWSVIPNLGRTGSSVTAFPVTVSEQKVSPNSPCLEYRVYLQNAGEVKVNLFLSPTLNFLNKARGIPYAISFDDQEPQIINMTNNPNYPDLNYDGVWNKWVADNINISASIHLINQPGEHVLKIWLVDAGIVLQKILIDTGGLKPSYLGPPESFRIIKLN